MNIVTDGAGFEVDIDFVLHLFIIITVLLRK